MALHYYWMYEDKFRQPLSGKSYGMNVRKLLRLAKPLVDKREDLSLENKLCQVVWMEGVSDSGNSPGLETRRQVDALYF